MDPIDDIINENYGSDDDFESEWRSRNITTDDIRSLMEAAFAAGKSA